MKISHRGNQNQTEASLTNNNQLLPDFFIVGAAKAGTTSIYQYLKQHPEIYLPPIKEVNYFCSDIRPENFRTDYARSVYLNVDAYIEGGMKDEVFHGFIQNWEQYKKIFNPAAGKNAIGELSNTYLFSEVAAKNIYEKFPQAKIIMILRNPVERAFSHYQMDLRNGLVKEDFITEFNNDRYRLPKGWGISNLYYELGLYSEQVKRFMQFFKREQILVLLHDNFVNHEKSSFHMICKFLNVNENFEFNFSVKHNQAKAPRNKFIAMLSRQKKITKLTKKLFSSELLESIKRSLFRKENQKGITDEARRTVAGYYADDINKLSQLLNIDLSIWK